MGKDKPRNLSDECKDCPYRDKWDIYDCLCTSFPHLTEIGVYGEGCNVPWDILEAIERGRNNVDQT